jgi:hypothetical protein
MRGRRRTAINLQNNSSGDEETDDEELRTDLSDKRRTRLAQVTRSTTAELQQLRVSGTTPWHTRIEKSSPASVQVENDLIVEESVISDNNRAAANTSCSVMGDAALLIPPAAVAVSSVETACAATANRVPTNVGTTVADLGEQPVVKAVADVMSAAVRPAVRDGAREQAMTMRAEEWTLPTCMPMIGPSSKTADPAEAGTAAPIAGSQAGPLITVSSSANITGQHSGSKRKASDHGDEFRTCSKRRSSCGGDDIDLDNISAQYISPKISSAAQERCSSCPTADWLSPTQPSQSQVQAFQVGYPSPPSESVAQIDHLSQLSESAVGTGRPSQLSGSAIRVHRPCLLSASAAHANRPDRLMTCCPNRVSTSDERMGPTPQPTNGTVLVMPVLSPVIRPVDPGCLTHRKRPRAVSASHIFDTNDPLQEPTRKRQTVPQERDAGLWTQWRTLARDGRRNT